jgi:hypothetical protein
METKIVRLSSGEEIICKTEMVDHDGTEFVKIKNPAILVPVGDGQLAFAPWLPYGDITDGLEIDMKFIVFVIKAQLELANQYNETVGNGIVVPTQGTPGMPGAAPGTPSLQISGS